MAKNVVVIGTQWGDEGKGKIVDWLSCQAKAVARFQGGHNAGHTLVIGKNTYKLSLVPSGIVHPNVQCYIGNGVVLNMQHLFDEINKLQSSGEIQNITQRLHISPGCPLILPYHVALDNAREAKRSTDKKIGTTGKGIGPAYEDKVARRGIRLYELFIDNGKHFKNRLTEILEYHNFALQNYYQVGKENLLNVEDIYATTMQLAEKIRPMLSDVSADLYNINANDGNILFEGAQGTLLDIDHGTYPFVTSSNCVAGQAAAGTGIGPHMLNYILGITKAYTTRVGAGPFPSELDIDKPGTAGNQMSVKGCEFGTVTGRQRRCGWFDAVALRRSAKINGLSGLCITKLDVLDGIEELKICTGYILDGKPIDLLPIGADEVARCKPIYETVPGWKESTFGVKSWQDLPNNAKAYLTMLEMLCEVPISIVSTGPEREETIVKRHPFE